MIHTFVQGSSFRNIDQKSIYALQEERERDGKKKRDIREIYQIKTQMKMLRVTDSNQQTWR